VSEEERTHGQWWDVAGDRVRVQIDDIRAIARAALLDAGAQPPDADFLIDVYLSKALQGDHVRGLGYLGVIIEEARAGRTDISPAFTVVREREGTALVEGPPNGSGPLLCRFAMNLAIDKARRCGAGVVAARGRSGAMLTSFIRQATDASMVGLAFVQSSPTVAPLGGYQPLLGNAPFAIGIPAGDRDPVLVDMSFTQSSHSGVMLAARQGEPVPGGVLLDDQGNPTTDSSQYPQAYSGGTKSDALIPMAVRGSLAPIGGHKGYAMIFAVGVLTALLAESSPPWELDYQRESRGSYGTVLVAIDPTAFRGDGQAGAAAEVDEFIETVISAPRKDPGVEILYPGQRSQELRRRRRASGVLAIPRADFELLEGLARRLGIAGPAPVTGPGAPAVPQTAGVERPPA
jgi:LDH2 family malate/lactate/ureidoglycolate dehydrogenase